LTAAELPYNYNEGFAYVNGFSSKKKILRICIGASLTLRMVTSLQLI
jgi:hypothetical protein